MEEIVDPYYMFKNYFRRHGVIFLENGTFNQFVDIVNSKLPEVLILIAHCKDGGIPETESVEFFDKMVLSDDFLRAPFIPYPLVLDLSVCKPLYLRKKMEIIHSNYSIFTSNNIKDLTIWLYTYSQIIAKMLKEHTKYLEAYVSFFKENHK
ncbi:MAG TPA: hypothetical protein VHA52_11240 [Candidatus Babeliaceae bacterium]|nr:hypothetical protein [Candidatus Babeliaceae bacterium]